MKKRKQAVATPLTDGDRAALGWILWSVVTCAVSTGCGRCWAAILKEGPLHA
jgi:hypothetical protein